MKTVVESGALGGNVFLPPNVASLIDVLFGTLLLLGLARAAKANPHAPGEVRT